MTAKMTVRDENHALTVVDEGEEGDESMCKSDSTVARKSKMRMTTLSHAPQDDDGDEEDCEDGSWTARAIRVILDPQFDMLVGVVVLLNSVSMGLETEVSDPGVLFVLVAGDIVFLVVFTLELLLRAFAMRQYLFNTLSDVMDAAIVVSGWVQVVLEIVLRGSDVLSLLAVLKVFRALRALRVLRMFVFFDGLWLAVSSFFACLGPLLWTCIFIMIILLIMSQFAVHLLGTNGDFDGVCLDYGNGCQTQKELFGATITGATSLFQVMTLDEWRTVTQPLCDRKSWAYLFFGFWICIGSLALMNLVTAVVIENSMQRTLNSEEFQRVKKVFAAEQEGSQIRSLLSKIDLSQVNPAELMAHRYEWTTLGVMLDALDIQDEADVEKLTKICDINGDGTVTSAELLDFCLILRKVSGDILRMALLQVSSETTDKWTAMEKAINHESLWISNAATIARLAKNVKDCFQKAGPAMLQTGNKLVNVLSEEAEEDTSPASDINVDVPSQSMGDSEGMNMRQQMSLGASATVGDDTPSVANVLNQMRL